MGIGLFMLARVDGSDSYVSQCHRCLWHVDKQLLQLVNDSDNGVDNVCNGQPKVTPRNGC